MLDREELRSARPGRGSVFVTVSGGPQMTGRIVSGYFRERYRYESEFDLLLALEGLCNSMGFPQAAFANRSFGARQRKTQERNAEACGEEDLEGIVEDEKATFIVSVMFRRNATFQGSITWVEKEKTQSFRSAFEMLKLMDEARGQSSQETVGWGKDPEPEK